MNPVILPTMVYHNQIKQQIFGSVYNFPHYQPTKGMSRFVCNDSYSRSPSSSILASSLQRDIFPNLATSQREADLKLSDMGLRAQAKSMNELQQRIMSQQEQNRQIRLRQRHQLFQMYHHQYPKSTITILSMLRGLKKEMIIIIIANN